MSSPFKTPTAAQQTLKIASLAARAAEWAATQEMLMARWGTADLSGPIPWYPGDDGLVNADLDVAGRIATLLSMLSELTNRRIRRAVWQKGFSNNFDTNKSAMEHREMLWLPKIFPKGAQDFDIESCKFIEHEEIFEALIEKFNLNIVMSREETGMQVLVLGTRQGKGMLGLSTDEKSHRARVVLATSSQADKLRTDGGLPTLVIEGRNKLSSAQILDATVKFVQYDGWMCPTDGKLDKASRSLAICYAQNASADVITKSKAQFGVTEQEITHAQQVISEAALARSAESSKVSTPSTPSSSSTPNSSDTIPSQHQSANLPGLVTDNPETCAGASQSTTTPSSIASSPTRTTHHEANRNLAPQDSVIEDMLQSLINPHANASNIGSKQPSYPPDTPSPPSSEDNASPSKAKTCLTDIVQNSDMLNDKPRPPQSALSLPPSPTAPTLPRTPEEILGRPPCHLSSKDIDDERTDGHDGGETAKANEQKDAEEGQKQEPKGENTEDEGGVNPRKRGLEQSPTGREAVGGKRRRYG